MRMYVDHALWQMKNNEEAMCKVPICVLFFLLICHAISFRFIQGFLLQISTHLEYLSDFFYCFMSLSKSCAAIITILLVKIYTSKV